MQGVKKLVVWIGLLWVLYQGFLLSYPGDRGVVYEFVKNSLGILSDKNVVIEHAREFVVRGIAALLLSVLLLIVYMVAEGFFKDDLSIRAAFRRSFALILFITPLMPALLTFFVTLLNCQELLSPSATCAWVNEEAEDNYFRLVFGGWLVFAALFFISFSLSSWRARGSRANKC